MTQKPVEELDLAEENDPRNEPKRLNEPRNGDLKGHRSGLGDPLNDLLSKIGEPPDADYATFAETLHVSEATVKRNIQKLKQLGLIRRLGSKKTGHWEVIQTEESHTNEP